MAPYVTWRTLLPAIVALASYLLYCLFLAPPLLSGSGFDFGFDVSKVMDINIATATRSWELGAAAQALLELHNPDLTIFTKTPFPAGLLPRSHDMTKVKGLQYIKPAIWTNGTATLTEGEGWLSLSISNLIASWTLKLPALMSTNESMYAHIYLFRS